MNESTTLIATYADQAGAELLAKFVKSAGIACAVTTSESPGLAAFHVCVATPSIGDVRRLVDLTPLTQYEDPMSAQIVAGRLISEGVPCVLGGRGTLDNLGFVGRYSGPYTLSVPKRFLSEAKRILDEPPISEKELTELALHTTPDPEDRR